MFGLGLGISHGAMMSALAQAASFYVDLTQGVLPPWLTYSMASNQLVFDALGNLQYAPNNQILNSTMQGAVAGTVGSGGSFPTNWNGVVGNGLAFASVGTGVEAGLPYTDVRIYGTTTAGGQALIGMNPNSGLPAKGGQSFIQSFYIRTVAGSPTGFSGTGLELVYDDSAFTFAGNVTAPLGTLGVASVDKNRVYGATGALASNVAYLIPSLYLNYNTGAAIDWTFRIAAPQVELVTAAQTTPNPFLPTSGTAAYGPAFDYDPVAHTALGIRKEQAATNAIPNSALVGASAGNKPNTWSLLTATTGLTETWGTPTVVNGIPTTTVTISGTPSATGTTRLIVPIPNGTQIAAASGQTWSHSWYLAATNNTNIAFQLYLGGLASDGNTVEESFVSGNVATTSILTRYKQTSTLANALSVYLRPAIQISYTAGQAINTTLTIALPQAENSLFATSPILTYGTASTRSEPIMALTGAALTAAQGASATLGATAKSEGFGTNPRIWGFDNGTAPTDGSYWSGPTTYSGIGGLNITTPNVMSAPIRSLFGWNATSRNAAAAGVLATRNNALGGYANTATVQLGSTNFASRPWSGWFSEVGVWNKEIPDATKQKLSTNGTRWA